MSIKELEMLEKDEFLHKFSNNLCERYTGDRYPSLYEPEFKLLETDICCENDPLDTLFIVEPYSIMYSDLVSNCALATNNLTMFETMDRWFNYYLRFMMFECDKGKIVKFHSKMTKGNQFASIHNLSERIYPHTVLLTALDSFTLAFFRTKILYNHIYHGQKELKSLLDNYLFDDYILKNNIDDQGNEDYYICRNGDQSNKEVVAVATGLNLKMVGMSRKIEGFTLCNSTDIPHIIRNRSNSNKKNNKNKLIKYIILSQLINQNK